MVIIIEPLRQNLPMEDPNVPQRILTDFQKLGSELPFHNSELELTPESRIFREAVNEFGPHRNLLEIYNHWIVNFLEKQIVSKTIVNDEYKIYFQNVRVFKPEILPWEARDATKSYMAKIVVDLADNHDHVHENVVLGTFPCMVGSVICNLYNMSEGELIENFEDPNDPFGYFIIKGTEKLIVTLERLRYSSFLTYIKDDKDEHPETRMTCTEGFNTYIVIMKYIKGSGTIGVRLQNQNSQEPPINIFFLFRVFGWDHNRALEEILKHIPSDYKIRVTTHLKASIHYDTLMFSASKEAEIKAFGIKKNTLEKLKSHKDVVEKVRHDLFPNVSETTKKLELLAIMTSRQVLFSCGYNNGEDRDSWSNKQLQTAGVSLEVDMNSILTEFISSLVDKSRGQPNLSAVAKKIEPNEFTKKFIDTFNNNLGPQGKINSKSNNIATSEALRRETPLTVYSLLTRINTPTDRQVKKANTRNVHGTQIGTVCIVQTPESIHCGLVKHTTVVEHTSLSRPDHDVTELINKSKRWSETYKEGLYPVIVNGKPLGFASFDLVREINLAKRTGKLPYDSTCLLNGMWNIIEYYSNGGRVMYPVFVVEDNVLLYEYHGLQHASFKELLQRGMIMYIDAREQEQEYNQLAESTNTVRLTKNNPDSPDRFTFALIDGLSLYGINASLVPYGNMTQGPRVVYQSSMYNQALGIYHYNHMYRFDTSFKKLIGPTRSITESIISEAIGMNTVPSSQTAILAIYADPTNYEDAVTFNKQFLERKNMNYVIYSTHKIILKDERDSYDSVAIPKTIHGSTRSRYNSVDQFGYPIIGARIKRDDCILGIVRVNGGHRVVIDDQGDYEIPEGIKQENVSFFAGIGDEGYIDSYRVTINDNKEKSIKIKIAQFKMVNIGDKFSAAQTAQKGTCGNIVDSERSIKISTGPNKGLSPHILFNPHSLPSRMTINMIFSMLLLRWAAYTGKRIDTTTHHQTMSSIKQAIEDMYQIAKRAGMTDEDALDWANGEEECVGPTGKRLKMKVFICPCTEQLLRHLVDIKIQCRGIGPIKKSNHQPTQGRSNNGGLRTGEMERDAMVAHGAAYTLQERMRDVADLYECVMCKRCGKFAIVNPYENKITCMKCKEMVDPVKVKIPFIIKSTIQTIGGLQIDTTFDLKPLDSL